MRHPLPEFEKFCTRGVNSLASGWTYLKQKHDPSRVCCKYIVLGSSLVEYEQVKSPVRQKKLGHPLCINTGK